MRLRLRRSTSNDGAMVSRSVAGGKQHTAQADAPTADRADALEPPGCARTSFSSPKMLTPLHAHIIIKEQHVSRPRQGQMPSARASCSPEQRT